ncbi:MAG: ROK family protein [Planctomycetes bacterium]|nr:ROK family protein [Planctomycetota bacterium]
MKAIGIDIGGTKIAVAPVDATGGIRARVSIPTEAERGFDRAVARMIEAADRALGEAGWSRGDLAGIGIGCAGPVDPARGLINNPYTLAGWDRCDIVSPLRRTFGVPVRLENDADAAAVGEWCAGAGRGASPLVMLTIGTGIGGAVLSEGRIVRGARGEHPELGHVPVDPDGPPCYCGERGCLEAIASGAAINEAGAAAGFADSRAVFRRAADGDPAARAIIARAVRAFRIAARTILHTILPERIVLGGGISDDHYEVFAAPFREAIATATMAPREGVSVAKAILGNDAGLVGAAMLPSLVTPTPPSPA